MSAVFLTAPKLPEVFCNKTVRPCEPVSVNCPSEPEKLHCLDIIQINEAIEATKLQPLTKDSMKQQRSAVGEQGGLQIIFENSSKEFHFYIKVN